MRFFEQRHVKDVLAFLRIVANPKDELSWKRALKVFPRVGERSAAAVWEAVSTRPDPLASFRERGARGIELPRGASGPIESFRALLERLDSPALRASPADAIRTVVETSTATSLGPSSPTERRAWTTSSSSRSSRRPTTRFDRSWRR
jgi:DNA helicase-2/ATP-dependent DNA helicase PcrA